MPKSLQYKAGSLIYCKGEDADKVFILNTGKVSLVFSDIKGNDIRNPVQPGEFFGVKSALGQFPREENAIALSDSTIVGLTVPEFESMAMSNTRIILKMLKVFSSQMRRVHAQVASLLSTDEIKPEDGLFSIGDKYLKSKRYDHAEHVFRRYLGTYPNGKYTDQAAKKLKQAEAAIFNPAAVKENESEHDAENYTAPPPLPPDDSGVSAAYYDALNLISQKKYKEAMEAFNQIIAANEIPEWSEKSSYESGHCLFLLNKFEECIKYFKKFLVLYPEYPDLRDAMYFIGQAYEKLENDDQAAVWYKKIVAASGEEKDSARTKAMKALNALEKK